MDLQTLLRLYEANRANDINSHVADLRNFVWVINRLVHALYESKVIMPSWNQYLEALLIRFSWGCCSLCGLAEGTRMRTHIEDKDISYPDLPTIYISARAIIETYLVTYHLNFERKNKDELDFRNQLYTLSGLCMRQKFPTPTEEGKQKLQTESLQIGELREKIKTNIYFQSLAQKRQSQLLTGDFAKEVGFEELIRRRGIKNMEFQMMWRLCSNYAHSEYMGVLQLPEYIKNRTELNASVHMTITQIMIVAVLLIRDLVAEFPAASIVYSTLKEEYRDKAQFWGDLASLEYK